MQAEVLLHKNDRSWTSGKSSDLYLMAKDFQFFLIVDGVETLSEKMAFAKNYADAFEILDSYGVFTLAPQTTTYISSQVLSRTEVLGKLTLSSGQSGAEKLPPVFRTRDDQIVLDRAAGFGTRDDIVLHSEGRSFVTALTTGEDLLVFEIREFGEIHFAGVAELSGWSVVEGFDTLVGHSTTLFQAVGLANNTGSTLDLFARDSISIQGEWLTRFRRISEENYANPKKYLEWLRGSMNEWTSNSLLNLALAGQDSKLITAFASYLASLKTKAMNESWWHWREGSDYLMTDPYQTPVPFSEISLPEKGINEFQVSVANFDYQDPSEIADYLVNNS